MQGIIAIATAIPDMRALTSLNLSSNNLEAEGAKKVVKAIKVTMRLRSFWHFIHAHLTTGCTAACCSLLSTGERGSICLEFGQQQVNQRYPLAQWMGR
jgi:hypothetical protein